MAGKSARRTAKLKAKKRKERLRKAGLTKKKAGKRLKVKSKRVLKRLGHRPR